MKAILLVGGLGTRLQAVINNVPKAMAPICGVPFLQIMLNYLVSKGVSEIVLAVSYLRNSIINHFGDSFKGIKISYCIEKTPLGTGGAIMQAINLHKSFRGENIIVMNGDTFASFNPLNFMQFHNRHKGDATILVRNIESNTRYGEVIFDETTNQIQNFQEKPPIAKQSYISTGFYVINSSFFEGWSGGEKFSIEQDVFANFKTLNKNLYAYKMNDNGGESFDSLFIDIGIPADYQKAQTLPQITKWI